jgi:hypothetical protein
MLQARNTSTFEPINMGTQTGHMAVGTSWRTARPAGPSQRHSERRLALGPVRNGLHEIFVPTGPLIQTPGVLAGEAAVLPGYRTAGAVR